ncbi:hypothetical protein Scep_002794 [Stephania cephalantha]|uniref:Uncharacterized protein n=1 Tax=Stephania cephalantha TaxID=152367 RepID=A0AAP0Q5B3_9MAGN
MNAGEHQFPPLIAPPTTVIRDSMFAPAPAPSLSDGAGSKTPKSSFVPSSGSLPGFSPANGPIGSASDATSLRRALATASARAHNLQDGRQVQLVQLEVVNRISKPDKSKVRCGADQRPPKTTNLRFVAEQINDHQRRQETDYDVAESEQRNRRTADIRVDGVDDGQIAESTESTTDI